jgi:hypothetical protein
MQQQFKPVCSCSRNAFAPINHEWRGHVSRVNGNSAAKAATRLYSIQNSNQTSAGPGLGFEGRMV